jgi:hypothetical protein
MAIASTLAALVVTISAQSTVPPTLLDRVIAEADAIWRPTGLTIVWNRQAAAASSLNVILGLARGTARPSDAGAALGWIVFEQAMPRPQIYVSYANTLDLFLNSRGVVGPIDAMPVAERETYLSRAMGRALAHELGHYLLASREHTKTGLMKASRTAFEFFSTERRRFEVTSAQRAVVDARLNAERVAEAAPASPAPASSAPASVTPTRRASPHS